MRRLKGVYHTNRVAKRILGSLYTVPRGHVGNLNPVGLIVIFRLSLSLFSGSPNSVKAKTIPLKRGLLLINQAKTII